MTVAPNFDLQSSATLSSLSFDAMRMVMLHEAQEHDLPLITNSETEVVCATPFGHFGILALDKGLQIKVAAAQPDWLFMLKESLIEHLEHFVPEVAENLRWSDGPKVGSLPPNLHFAKVLSVTPVGTGFLRVQVKAENLSSFTDEAIHFRIILPPENVDKVEWPHIAENGATIWPKGEKALHKPVYTARKIDQNAGLLDFDIFIHDGGRVSNWASKVKPGDTTALIGPGGGGIPDTKKINLYGDETAFPAIARILESLPQNVTGRVVLLAQDGADCGYPVKAPEGVSITWITPDHKETLADIALAERQKTPDHFFWFAAEKEQAQHVRSAIKDDNLPSANRYVAAYWDRLK